MDIYGDIDPFLREIGRLVVNFNALEHSVRRLAWGLIDPIDQRIGQIVTDTLGAARIDELVRALLLHRTVDARVRDHIIKLLQQSAVIRNRRNDFVHAIWRVPNDAADLRDMDAARPPTRKKTDYTPVTGSTSKDEIAAVVSDAAQVSGQFDELIEQLLDQLRQAAETRRDSLASKPVPPNQGMEPTR
jgi:hypothetical protein